MTFERDRGRWPPRSARNRSTERRLERFAPALEQVTHAGPKTRVYSASFSPDGESVTFGMQGVTKQADVWRVGLDGTGLTPVTRTARWDSAPDWGGTAPR
jgi:hypothetical protein